MRKAGDKVNCYKMLTGGMGKGSREHMDWCISFTGEMEYKTDKTILEEEKKAILWRWSRYCFAVDTVYNKEILFVHN